MYRPDHPWVPRDQRSMFVLTRKPRLVFGLLLQQNRPEHWQIVGDTAAVHPGSGSTVANAKAACVAVDRYVSKRSEPVPPPSGPSTGAHTAKRHSAYAA